MKKWSNLIISKEGNNDDVACSNGYLYALATQDNKLMTTHIICTDNLYSGLLVCYLPFMSHFISLFFHTNFPCNEVDVV